MRKRTTSSDSGPSEPPRPGTTRSAALTLLARRDYTRAELQTKLAERGHSPADVAETLANLEERGLVDDRRVAAAHVRTSSRVKGRGRFRVARELEARGIPRALVEEALRDLPAADEAAAIRRILTRKRWPARPSVADRRRMYQHLLRRGFGSDAIRRALGRGTGEPDDPAEE